MDDEASIAGASEHADRLGLPDMSGMDVICALSSQSTFPEFLISLACERDQLREGDCDHLPLTFGRITTVRRFSAINLVSGAHGDFTACMHCDMLWIRSKEAS